MSATYPHTCPYCLTPTSRPGPCAACAWHQCKEDYWTCERLRADVDTGRAIARRYYEMALTLEDPVRKRRSLENALECLALARQDLAQLNALLAGTETP